MLEKILGFLLQLEDILWVFFGVPLILVFGTYLTIKSGFFQVRAFPRIIRLFWKFAIEKRSSTIVSGVRPLQAFFASIGGCIGIGNIVVVCTAVKLGGPGALFWIWVAAFVGMTLKYAEVFLGITYRIPNARGSYSGGPIYYLQRVFKSIWVPRIVCILLCIYGVEVLQFNIVSQAISHNYGINHTLVVALLLSLVLFAGAGGVRRVGEFCSAIIPVFTLFYVTMGLFILFSNFSLLPQTIALIFTSAFTGHSAIGAFAGSTFVLSMSQGIRRGCYTGDVGIGYAAVIHSETSVQKPAKQAALTIMEIFIDTFVIVTTSLLVIIITDIWQQPINEAIMVQTAFAIYFPHIEYIMPLFLFLLGYSTIIAYFCFGLNASEYMSQKWGRKVYYVIAAVSYVCFAFVDSVHALSVMAICGACLLIINIYGMVRLRNEIVFNVEDIK